MHSRFGPEGRRWRQALGLAFLRGASGISPANVDDRIDIWLQLFIVNVEARLGEDARHRTGRSPIAVRVEEPRNLQLARASLHSLACPERDAARTATERSLPHARIGGQHMLSR